MPRTAVLTAALLPLLCTGLAGQQQDAEACETGRISHIFIDNHSIFDTSDPELDERFAWGYRLANKLHIRTRDAVIRRELLFETGDCLDPLLLEESERMLRAHDFLSHVDIFALEQPDGSQHVIVDTQDEWSTRVDLRIGLENGISFEGVRLEEENLLGLGQSLGFFYFEREVTRDYGVAYSTPQLAGTRWDLRASVGRTRAGNFLRQGVAYPFVGEVGRWAFRQTLLREDRFFDYQAGRTESGALHVLLPLREETFDVGFVSRLGHRGSLTLLGGAVAYQSMEYPGGAGALRTCGGDFDRCVELTDTALLSPVRPHMQELSSVRAFVLFGQRAIWWEKRRGLDSMRGEQDVRLGAEAALAIGRSLPGVEAADDIFSTFTLYTGFGAENGLIVGRLRADGRRDLDAADAPEWQDVFAEGELLGYWTGWPRQTIVARLHAAGGWHTRVPFQLTLGGDRGLRGYAVERFPGGRRTVVTLEDRIYFGWPMPDALDLGGTLFVDAGRMWAGDAPFGEETGWRASAGVGLRASFPAGGRTTYRLDFAFPIGAGADLRDMRLILSVGELRGLITQWGDPQILRSRQAGVSGEIFHFPN